MGKLSPAERQSVVDTCNLPEYADLSPCEIVPDLADKGIYIASERTFYRILKEERMLAHRGRSKEPSRKSPTTYSADAPDRVWVWDITYLKGAHKGLYYYLYMILDIYDRSIVGWEVYESESADYASQLIRRTAMQHGHRTVDRLILHSDNGSPMKGATMLATLAQLGITPSNSRPRVSNDNAYAESAFKTLKYRYTFPTKGFASIEKAREWVRGFAKWYNTEHRHSGLKYLTPAQRRSGEGDKILKQRQEVYENAKAKHPERWKRGKTKNWELPKTVYLNPDRATKEALAGTGQSEAAS